MPELFVKTFKIGFLGLLPIWFVAPEPARMLEQEAGRYELRASGTLQIMLKGNISFVQEFEESREGKPYTTLTLDLQPDPAQPLHSLGIIISESNGRMPLQQGNYKVGQKIDGFLNCFEGVFGYANISPLGELPFFAESGVVSLHSVDSRGLKGSLEMNLRNSAGERIALSGSFSADPD